MNDNPYDVAMNPPEQSNEYWGEVSVNIWFCNLMTGIGKVPYDAQTLDDKGRPAKRYTAIDLNVQPIEDMQLEWGVERSVIGEFGEWPKYVLPSLKTCGLTNLQELDGRYAHVCLVSTGRKYTDKNGEEQEATTIKFLELYADEETCISAFNNGGNGSQPVEEPVVEGDEATAKQFMEFYVANIVKSKGNDIKAVQVELETFIKDNELLKKFYTIDSPAVTEMITKEMQK